MLDKSVPYVRIIMIRKAGAPIPRCALPEGYRFAPYAEGDERAWARIEASVLEFDSEGAALERFRKDYMTEPEQLRRRCIFVESPAGEKVATATAWWRIVNGRRRPWVHWVGVRSDHQGLGLGKAICAELTALMARLEGDVDIWLKTQTWSRKAVGIYRRLGFELTDEKELYDDYGLSYEDARRAFGEMGE